MKNELKLALQRDKEANKYFLNFDQLKAVTGEESACLAYFEGNDDKLIIIVAVDGRFSEKNVDGKTFHNGNKLLRQ